MSKRAGSALTPAQARKRKKKGVSSSRSVLTDPLETPLDANRSMRVWNANVENPGVVRKSLVPLQPEANEVQPEVLILEQVEDGFVEVAASVKTKKRERKRMNDSVSLLLNVYFC